MTIITKPLGADSTSEVSNEETFDHYAGNYEATVQRAFPGAGGDSRYYADRKTILLRSLLAESIATHVLDFGCGVGLCTESLLARISPVSRVTSLDVSSESIAIAQSRVSDPRAEFRTMTLEGLPAPDKQFSGSVAACVFHHIQPRERDFWMRELFRVTRPGGWVAIFEHNPLNPLTRRTVDRCPFDEGVQLLSPWETRKRMRDAGFSDVRIKHYLFFPAVLDALVQLERALTWLPMGGQYLALARRAPIHRHSHGYKYG